MSTAIRSCVVNMFHLYKKSFFPKKCSITFQDGIIKFTIVKIRLLFKTPLVNLNEETYLPYNDDKYKIRALMLVTKFSVKLTKLHFAHAQRILFQSNIFNTL